MPDLSAKSKASWLRELLSAHEELGHLRVRPHGRLLILESGPDDDPVPHARFRRDTVHLWILEMPMRGGRWDRTPFREHLDRLLEVVMDSFPWMLMPVA